MEFISILVPQTRADVDMFNCAIASPVERALRAYLSKPLVAELVLGSTKRPRATHIK